MTSGDEDYHDKLESDHNRKKVKFEIYGEEMIKKIVNSSGNSGRVYLPPEWIGKKVKVVKC
ncbi:MULTISPECIES: DUF2080 family transposase-associated protein [Desulfobacula]|uniref:Uncharacterized protein n=2 Tax=Desulfobacula TaxID=28222 RepID=K0N376_DESTT|nr:MULTISPECIES: DUF2080 family transposase-associated protein [Desulfobacula]CCK78554.1 uncharacterized protein TOL2_C03840 [Desulfobacula toluolica Tol2]SDT90009.1 Putative transposon-encoded protein [Desulfobacula phenolica]